MQNFLKRNFQRYLDLSFPVKFIITALMSTIGGSTYIAFLSEYATYYYAWSEGFRIPAEGSPYLKATITTLGFLAISASLLLFLTIYAIGTLFWLYITQTRLPSTTSEVAHLLFKAIAENRLREKLSNKLIFIATGLISTLVGLLSFTVEYVDGKPDPWIAGAITSFMTALSCIVILKRKYLIIFSAICALLFSISAPAILFNHTAYETLLNEIGYGGRLQIIVSLPNTNDKVQASLYLRTTSSLFISINKSEIIEYPISEIKYIQYLKSGELKNRDPINSRGLRLLAAYFTKDKH